MKTTTKQDLLQKLYDCKEEIEKSVGDSDDTYQAICQLISKLEGDISSEQDLM